MKRYMQLLQIFLLGAVPLGLENTGWAARFEEARIYIEYNSTDNDLGFHVFLDGEDWKRLRIVNPYGTTVLEVEGEGPYKELGLTELFFEGAEPSLDEFPLEELLDLFPEGQYMFIGVTVDGAHVLNRAMLSHAVPAGPSVTATSYDDTVIISWDPVTGPAEGFPNRKFQIVGYQIVVGSFQVTLPASSTQVTLPPEFVTTLGPGEHEFEVLAIEKSGNQTITADVFEVQ